MERTLTIDQAGRLVIPKDLRDRHRLKKGSRLRVLDRDDAIVLEPVSEPTRLVRRQGYLVLSTPTAADRAVDHRQVRDERLDRIAGKPA